MPAIQDLDARQRMINMMYIIFIAMLALNMSKEVLQSFGDVNNSLQTSITQTEKRNSTLMAGLAVKAQDQPQKYKDLQQQALQIQKASTNLVSYIDKLKSDLVADIDRDENGQLDYQKMDRADEINLMFFSNDKLSDRGKELLNKIKAFKEKALALAQSTGNQALAETINKKFDLSPVKTKDGGKVGWLRYNYEEYPLIAGITKLTNVQADAAQIQTTLLTSMVSGQMASDISMTNYQAILIPDKTAFFSGEHFKGKVILGRFDNTLQFDNVMINGNKVTDIRGGQVYLDMPAGNVGDHKIEGKLQFKEGDSIVTIPVSSNYTVIPKPNSAVISADKMNVIYRGVSNPLTISIPGVSSVHASAPALHHVRGAHYAINPTNIRAHSVNISVSGKLPNGTTISDSKKFRIKEIPHPVATIRGQTGGGGPIRMQRNGLKISSVGALIPDFDFNLKIQVTGFKLQIPGKPIVAVRGQHMNARAKRIIAAARRGSMVQIFDIQAHVVGNSSYHLPQVRGLTVQLTN